MSNEMEKMLINWRRKKGKGSLSLIFVLKRFTARVPFLFKRLAGRDKLTGDSVQNAFRNMNSLN